MKFNWLIGLVFMLLNIINTTLAARRLTFRPLSADEVYRILKDAGREDAVPEGRIVTQGIAAISGFALGLTKGIAVPLAIGLATANSTQQFLSNINYTALANSFPTIPPLRLPTINYTALTSSLPTINYTALASSLPTINYTALTSSLPTITLPTLNVDALTSLLKGQANNNVQYTTQEICFNSRSLNDINDPDYEDDDDAEASQGRQATAAGTGTATNNNPATTAATSPTATGEQANTGTNTDTEDNDSSATNIVSTTQTNNGGAITCVVIQKPVTG